MGSLSVVPRRKEFVVAELQEEVQRLRQVIEELREINAMLQQEIERLQDA